MVFLNTIGDGPWIHYYCIDSSYHAHCCQHCPHPHTHTTTTILIILHLPLFILPWPGSTLCCSLYMLERLIPTNYTAWVNGKHSRKSERGKRKRSGLFLTWSGLIQSRILTVDAFLSDHSFGQAAPPLGFMDGNTFQCCYSEVSQLLLFVILPNATHLFWVLSLNYPQNSISVPSFSCWAPSWHSSRSSLKKQALRSKF